MVAGNRDDVANPQREEGMSLGGHHRDAFIDLPDVKVPGGFTFQSKESAVRVDGERVSLAGREGEGK